MGAPGTFTLLSESLQLPTRCLHDRLELCLKSRSNSSVACQLPALAVVQLFRLDAPRREALVRSRRSALHSKHLQERVQAWTQAHGSFLRLLNESKLLALLVSSELKVVTGSNAQFGDPSLHSAL
jgi:hypothetical protein